MDSNISNTSFKDPSGFVFKKEEKIFRQINLVYKDDYDFLISSGLYENLISKRLLIEHEEVNTPFETNKGYKIIRPREIPFISYPYEWCFSQLKDAALLTLEIQKTALEHQMSLKDSTAYNVQFYKGKPTFIDTLSFEKYKKDTPWVAYKQFCQHFLAPLALMAYKDIRLNNLSKLYIDGIPLDLASSLLPFYSGFNIFVLTHIHMHAKSQKHYEDKADASIKQVKMDLFGLKALINSLEDAVKSLKLPNVETEWGDYYNNTNYDQNASDSKSKIINEFIEILAPKTLCDLGANLGAFSREAAKKGINTINFDIDPVAIEKNYLISKQNGEENILALINDLTNPSPAIGWANQERESFSDRAHFDTVMALALIHHLSISNNLPFENSAKFFSKIAKSLIIEFVPKEDSQVKKLLSTREDIFPSYTQEGFEKVYSKYFDIKKIEKVLDSERTLYLMVRR